MTSHSRFELPAIGTAALLVSAGLAGLVLAGCGSGADQSAMPVAAPARPSAPPPPPRPEVTPVEQLMAELGIDRRVRLPEELAPSSDAERRAVLAFYDSFARGDSKAVASMLSELDREELDELVASDEWAQTTKKIVKIDVRCGKSPDARPVALGIFHIDSGNFEPQLWYYQADEAGAVFEAVATPPGVVDRLSGADWIAAWFALLEEELALADAPDEEIVITQRDVSDPNATDDPASPSYAPGDGDPSKPSAPGGPGTGRRPKAPRRPAPGKGP
jgi:ketosteroid isomerase-like protein